MVLPSLRAALTVVLAVMLVAFVVQRLRSSEDPSIRYQSSTAAGSTSILLSGVHVSIALSVALVVVTWPLVVSRPVLGLALAVVVGGHWFLEKRETEMN